MDQLEIIANNRTAFGKKNRALRREGIIPIHVYGLGQPSLSLQAEIKPLTNTLISAGRTTPVTIKTDESSTVVLIRDVDRHAVSGNIQHVKEYIIFVKIIYFDTSLSLIPHKI